MRCRRQRCPRVLTSRKADRLRRRRVSNWRLSRIQLQSGTSLPELMELGGWKSYEMVLRYAHLAPEKLSFVAGRIERQTSRHIEEASQLENVAKNATFSLRSVH